MAIEVLAVDREKNRIRLLAEEFTLTFVLVKGKVRLTGKSIYKQRISSPSDLFVPDFLYQEAIKVAYAILCEKPAENKKGGTMSVPCAEGAQSNLFPDLAPDFPKRKLFRWEITIGGEQYTVDATTKRQALAEAVSAVSPQHGRGTESRYRAALRSGARVVSKTALE